jgi:hypothetical protein
MLSSVYQQSSRDEPSHEQQQDPENRLLWKMNRRRLDWEALRDSLLAVSGKLDLTLGGPAMNQTTPPFSARRSVYGFIDRQNLPSVLRAFDFAPPDASSPQRHLTTVPQQALFLMNSPFLRDQARGLAARLDLMRVQQTEQRIDAVYRTLFSRAAEPEEIALGKKFLESNVGTTTDSPSHLTRWEEYLQTLLLANEFLFVD